MVKQAPKRGIKENIMNYPPASHRIHKEHGPTIYKAPQLLIARDINPALPPDTESAFFARQAINNQWADNLQPGQWVSSADYMKIVEVDGDCIRVQLDNGDTNEVSLGYIHAMYSGVHFNKVIECNRHEMVERLQSAGDMVFTVAFYKKIQSEQVADKLLKYADWDITKESNLRAIASDVLAGDKCILTGRLSEACMRAGRSVVLDLNVAQGINTRQVDHRTLDCLILDGIKYVIKGRKINSNDIGKRIAEGVKITPTPGDWFSKVFYLKCEDTERNDVLFTSNEGSEFKIKKSVINDFMNSAHHFVHTHKVTRTELLKRLREVKDSVFTVQFNKQVTDLRVIEKLKRASTEDLRNPRKAKRLAESLIAGDDCEITGYLHKTENDMGRSVVIDLNVGVQPAFRQVDHRIIKSIVVENAKYEVK